MVVTYDYLARHGRLGNQMFQYALLVGLKYKIDCEIIIDTKVRALSPLFHYFNLTECKVEPIEINNVYHEKIYHFDPNVYQITEDTDFRGYYQTERYFEHCKDVIKREYTFRPELVDRVNSFLKDYEGKQLVSLHVRRGDYVELSELHPVCTLDYYLEAMNMLDGDNVQFICMSDDVNWCTENIKKENVVFHSLDPIYDMCMISKCDNHIMSNSTFSWWGTWLCENKDRKIIAPKTWYSGRYLEWDLSDLYREEFIKL